ncbi:hypothetical protein Tco_0295616 [Tanacetum coccineum]
MASRTVTRSFKGVKQIDGEEEQSHSLNDKGKGNCLDDISSDQNTFVECNNEHGANLFVDIQKTIKVDGGKDLANVGVIKIRRVDDMTFMKEASLEVLKNSFVFVREALGLMVFRNIVGGVLVVLMDSFRHFEPKEINLTK